MGVSKVTFYGEILVDLTADTVGADSLLAGYTAHTAAGEQVTGTLDIQAQIDAALSSIENASY